VSLSRLSIRMKSFPIPWYFEKGMLGISTSAPGHAKGGKKKGRVSFTVAVTCP
jgi:hypothetical protein